MQQQQQPVTIAFLSPAQYGHLAPLLCVVRALLKSDPSLRSRLAIYTSHGDHARHRRIDSAVDGHGGGAAPADPDLEGVAMHSFQWSTVRYRAIPEELEQHEASLPPLARDFLSGARAMWLELSVLWRKHPDFKPQMIVADHCCLAAPYLAAAFNIPFTVLYSNCLPLPSWSPFEPDLYQEISAERHRASWSSILMQAARIVGCWSGVLPPNLLLRTYHHFGKTIGASKACDPVQQGDLSLVNTTRLLFPQQKHLARNVHFVGPLVSPPSPGQLLPDPATIDAALSDVLRSGPFVYVSFGTLFRPTQEQWNAVLGALRMCASQKKTPLNLIISAPKDDHHAIRTGLEGSTLGGVVKKSYINHWVPQQVVLRSPNLQLFISHAGNNSTLEAMVAGAGMMLFPFAADQPFNAYTLQRLRASTVCTFEQVRPGDIRLAESISSDGNAAIKQLAAVYAGSEHTSSALAAQLIREEMFLHAHRHRHPVKPALRVQRGLMLVALFLLLLLLLLPRCWSVTQ
jgi:hypothetical protein